MTKMSEECNEDAKEIIREDHFKEILTAELDRLGNGGTFIWFLFFLCVTPNILNGFHVSSYTLLGHLPDDQWCTVEDLRQSNWSIAQQRSISQKDLTTKGCSIWNWDYRHLSQMSYDDAVNYTARMSAMISPAEIPCMQKGFYEFDQPESTFVAEWKLVCDRAIQRTSAQVFLSLGKFFGSFSFGIFADKFGRKYAFNLGAATFLISSFFCTFSPWYGLFLFGRFGLGAAASGLFYPAFTMLIENICVKHRSWMSIAFSASYPIGLVILALAAYLVKPWRYLQLVLTLPALLLILNCLLMNESPRWLIAKGSYAEAYRIIFKKKSIFQIKPLPKIAIKDEKLDGETKLQQSLWNKIKEGPLKQIVELFSTRKMRRLIFTSYFMFCVTSLSYYVTALNAPNLAVSRFLYVAITGLVDIPSYLVPVMMLRFTGRRVTTMSLFMLTGMALLMMLALSNEDPVWIVSFAILGRFGISATYSIVTLYTAELYPTEIRNSALGTCSTWAHVGSISAPYVVDILGMLGWYIPTTICGCCLLVSGLLTLTLPETSTGKLPESIVEVPSAAACANAIDQCNEKSTECDKLKS